MLAVAATQAHLLPLTYLNPYASGISLNQGIATGWYGAPTLLAHSLTHTPLAYGALTHAPALLTAPAAHTLVATAGAPESTILTTPALVAAPSA